MREIPENEKAQEVLDWRDGKEIEIFDGQFTKRGSINRDALDFRVI